MFCQVVQAFFDGTNVLLLAFDDALQQKTEGKIVQGGQVLSLSSIGTAAQIEDQSSDLLAMSFLIGHEML